MACLAVVFLRKILLIKASGKWEYPGGRVQLDETPLEAASRKWCEETQLTLPESFEYKEFKVKRYTVFVVCVNEELDVSSFRPSAKHTELKWLEPSVLRHDECSFTLLCARQRVLEFIIVKDDLYYDTTDYSSGVESVHASDDAQPRGRTAKKRSFNSSGSHKRQKVVEGGEYVEKYSAKAVELLLKVTQTDGAPEWLSSPKNKYRIQLQLKFLLSATKYNPEANVEGKQLYRIDDVIYQVLRYRQSSDEGGKFGSKYPQGCCNYQQMKREVRSCLAANYYLDADMDNAHFRLLLDDCEARGIACESIRDYVGNRADILKRLMVLHDISREMAKQAFISVLFEREDGDPYGAFLAKSGLRYSEESEALVSALFEEAKSIRKLILERENDEGRNWANRANKDHVGARFAVYMQTKCAEALDYMVQCLRNQGFCVDSLIHDGCHVQKSDRDLNLATLNEAFRKKYKNGKLKIKAFETTLDEADFPDLLPYRHEFNNNILKAAPLTKDEIIPDDHPQFRNQDRYLVWKTELVAKMNCNVAYISAKNEFMVKTGPQEYEVKRRNEAQDYFAHYIFHPSKANKPVGTMNAFDIWRQSSYRLIYNKKVCNPRPVDHVEAAKGNEFNVFKGFAIVHDDVIDDGGDPAPFVDHIARVWCRKDERMAKCVIQFFAQMLQTPWIRVDWGLYLRGEQGSMKNFVLDQWIKHILGSDACFVTHDAERIFGKFNQHVEGKILIGNDEAVSTYDKKGMNQLKGFTTSTKIFLEDKGKSTYEVEALHRLITFSNDAQYANVGVGQRRGFFLETDDMYADVNCPTGSEAAQRRQAHIERCLGCSPQTVAKYLYEYDISDFNARRVIHTKYEQAQIEGSLSPVESFGLGIVRGDICFMKKATSNEETDAYDLDCAIPKDVIFKTFLAQNLAQTRHYKSPQFWKEFKAVFKSMTNCKIHKIPSISFGNEYDILEKMKVEFRTCMKDPKWVI